MGSFRHCTTKHKIRLNIDIGLQLGVIIIKKDLKQKDELPHLFMDIFNNIFKKTCGTVQSESHIWTEREVGPLLINILGYPTEWFSSNMSHFAGYHLSLPFYPV